MNQYKRKRRKPGPIKMAAQLIVHHDFLHKVMKRNRATLLNATTKQINILVEIVYNLLNSKNIPLSGREIAILRPIHSRLLALSGASNADTARQMLFKLSKSQLSAFIIPALVATKLK